VPPRATAFCLAWLLAAPAAAQSGPRVVALSPTGSAADWAPSLRVELAYVGGELVPGELDPDHLYGPDSTTAVRVAAQVVGADAAVWLGHRRDRVHVVLTRRTERFAAPLQPRADARTVALVAASLLDEALIQPTRSAGPSRGSALTRPIQPVEQLTDDEVPPDHEVDEAPRPDRDGVRVYGGIGTGGLALISDVAFDPGTLLRATLGLQLVRNFRVQATLEGGLFRDRIVHNGGGLELQPFGRFCPELVGVADADPMVDLQIGGHGCVGLAEMREHAFFDPFFGPTFIEGLMLTVAGGGFIAVELRPSERVSVTFRADLDGTAPVERADNGGSANRQPDVLASLSTQVGFW